MWKFDGGALEEVRQTASKAVARSCEKCNTLLQVAMIDDKTLVLLGVGDIMFIIRSPRTQPKSKP